MAQFYLPDRKVTKEMRYQLGYALSDLAYEHDKILALDADLRSSTGLHIFEHYHPAKLVKVGIAEQNLIAVAAGLSQEGYIPFPCTFDAFSRRFMDQLVYHGRVQPAQRQDPWRVRRPLHWEIGRHAPERQGVGLPTADP